MPYACLPCLACPIFESVSLSLSLSPPSMSSSFSPHTHLAHWQHSISLSSFPIQIASLLSPWQGLTIFNLHVSSLYDPKEKKERDLGWTELIPNLVWSGGIFTLHFFFPSLPHPSPNLFMYFSNICCAHHLDWNSFTLLWIGWDIFTVKMCMSAHTRDPFPSPTPLPCLVCNSSSPYLPWPAGRRAGFLVWVIVWYFCWCVCVYCSQISSACCVCLYTHTPHLFLEKRMPT